MKTVNILGSTGSIGQSTLKVITKHADKFKVGVLTAQTSVQELATQAIKFNATLAVIGDKNHYSALKEALSGHNIDCAAGEQAIIDAAAHKADITMAGIVGMAGLQSLMKAIEQGGVIALANKEPLVAAGDLVLAACQKSGAILLPVDSEHNAIFQCLESLNKSAVERLVLTASGGPFRDWSLDKMMAATPEQALKHPNWNMGAKISIDSATMMNKALEVIEAHKLFNMPADKIEVLVHPQSIVHSMVEYCDGSVLCQMGASDMCTPITNVMGWPKRIESAGEKLDLKTLSELTFKPVDERRFPSVRMAYDCLDSGLAACITLNAANEVAVAAFLDHKIAFLDMYKMTAAALDKLESAPLNSLNDIVNYDIVARLKAESMLEALTLGHVG